MGLSARFARKERVIAEAADSDCLNLNLPADPKTPRELLLHSLWTTSHTCFARWLCLAMRLDLKIALGYFQHFLTIRNRGNMIKSLFAFTLCLLLIPAARALPQSGRDQESRSSSLINIRVSRTTQVVNYRDRSSTKIDFQGTALMSRAAGKAEIQARNGRIAIKAEFEHIEPASTFGSAYLTYVLWAISPEGNPNNLGELLLDDGKSKLEVTTNLQTFAMIVTAEPYFAVSYPSEIVALENVVRGDTRGAVSSVDAKFELLQRGTHDNMRLERYLSDSKVPLSLYEARNALRIAKAQGAARCAPESWSKGRRLVAVALRRAEDYQLRKQHKAVATAAREAVQAAEDARNIAVRRQEDERIAEQQRALMTRRVAPDWRRKTKPSAVPMPTVNACRPK